MGSWRAGASQLFVPSSIYLGVDFTSNGAWDEHVKSVLQNGRKTNSQVHSNRVYSVVRPTLEYGSEVWEGNKAPAAAFFVFLPSFLS